MRQLGRLVCSLLVLSIFAGCANLNGGRPVKSELARRGGNPICKSCGR